MASFSGASTPASNQFTINFQDCINQLITLRDSDLLPVRDSEVSAICLFLQEVVAIIYRFQAHSQTHPQIPATISIYPNEISYVSAADANRQLTLTHERQSAAGVVQESPEELKSHIRDAGKLNIACSHFYKAKAINLFLFRASPPLNFMAAKRDGWFDGLQGSDAEWEVLYHNRTVPYRSLAVKITEHVMWIYDPAYDPKGPPVFDASDPSRPKRLGIISGWAMPRALLTLIKNKGCAKVKTVMVGGGNNPDGEGRRMSCQWVINEVMKIMNPDAPELKEIVAEHAWHEVPR
ncbi:hypothetical protein MMC12_001386 [Toensbergia leucococca]|nr:hypothetical protein [Toensbergia leucococca]